MIAEYVIWNDTRGRWLADDEKSWTAKSTSGAAVFTDSQLAEEVRERETEGTDATYTMGWVQ